MERCVEENPGVLVGSDLLTSTTYLRYLTPKEFGNVLELFPREKK